MGKVLSTAKSCSREERAVRDKGRKLPDNGATSRAAQLQKDDVCEEHAPSPTERPEKANSTEARPEEDSVREGTDAKLPDTQTPSCSHMQGEISELEKRVEKARRLVIVCDDERARQVRAIDKMRDSQRPAEIRRIELMMASLAINKTPPLPTRSPPEDNDSGVDCSPPSVDDEWSLESSTELSDPSRLYELIKRYSRDVDVVIDMAKRHNPLPRPIRPRIDQRMSFPCCQSASDYVQKREALTFVSQLRDDELSPGLIAVLQREHFPVKDVFVSRHFLLEAFFARFQRSSPCAFLNQLVNGVTVLFQAIEARLPDVVSELLHYGADPRVRSTKDGFSGLHGQVVRGGGDMSLSTVKALIYHFPYDSDEFRDLRDMVDASGYSALTLALMIHDGNSGEAHRELLDTARFLLRSGARPQPNWRDLGFDREVVSRLLEEFGHEFGLQL